MENLKPVSVAGATFVIQLALLIIIHLGIRLERNNSSEGSRKKERGYSLTNVLAILSFLVVVFSKDFYTVWGPIMGDLQLPTVDRFYSLLAVFLLDIVATIFLIMRTGGTRASPFTAVLFLLPTLAVFLREPPGKFLTYTFIVGVFYWFTCGSRYNYSRYNEFGADNSLASHRAVNIGCLILTTIIAYITRPLPI